MKVFAISDLHLSVNNPKPMDIFGPAWENYIEKIFVDWREKVGEEDLVLLAGDFSWAMKLENTKEDFALLSSLPGKKIIIRGNHDYWWKSISAVRAFLPQNFYAIQNDAIKFEKLTYDELIARDLKVIDGAAGALARENHIKQLLFSLDPPENIYRAVIGERTGTLIE